MYRACRGLGPLHQAEVDKLCTHKAVRTGLNMCKNLPTEMGKYPRIPHYKPLLVRIEQILTKESKNLSKLVKMCQNLSKLVKILLEGLGNEV